MGLFSSKKEELKIEDKPVSSKDIEIIVSKLDLINSRLENINERIKKIEKIAEESQT